VLKPASASDSCSAVPGVTCVCACAKVPYQRQEADNERGIGSRRVARIAMLPMRRCASVLQGAGGEVNNTENPRTSERAALGKPQSPCSQSLLLFLGLSPRLPTE
jgi:hypothetical protein